MTIKLNNDVYNMNVGDYIWCKYTSTVSGIIGTFSDFAIKSDSEVSGLEIPTTSSATPNGYFKFIVVYDMNGKKILIADRVIQHSISWDTINSNGLVSGKKIDIGKYGSINFRLMSGGVSATDKDNEWDNYIVGSNLNGAITAGSNAIWNNGNNHGSWTSSVVSANPSNRARRGSVSYTEWYSMPSSSARIYEGYRPVIEISFTHMSFILHNGIYKKYDTSWSDYSNTLPTVDQFISDGMSDLSVFDRQSKTETIVMNDDINSGSGEVLGEGKVFKKKIDLKKYFDLLSINVK